MTTELVEIKGQFSELQKRYRETMPKVDPGLIADLLLRQTEDPDVVPMYLLEVFTKEGLDTEAVREYIISKTGMSPAIYDRGTHYVTNQKLTLDILKEISDSDDVLEVTGEYTGGLGSYGATHEHEHKQRRGRAEEERFFAKAKQEPQPGEPKAMASESRNDYKIAMYVAGGIVGAIVLAGFIISGGLVPNASTMVVSDGAGLVHGFVGGPSGLPAVGATVIAVQQGADFTASAFVSVDGQYSLNLQPGEYILVVAFPDGTDKVVNNLQVASGVTYQLNVSY